MFELTRRFPFGSMFEAHRELDDLFGRFLGHVGGPAPDRSYAMRRPSISVVPMAAPGDPTRRRAATILLQTLNSTSAWRFRALIPRTSR